MLEVPVAMMNGTAAAMRSSRLRGRLRMAGAWTIEDFSEMSSTFSEKSGGDSRFFGKLGPTSLFAVNGC